MPTRRGSSRHFFQLWKPRQVVNAIEDDPSSLNHSGSEQLYKVQPGDTLWIVTVRQGELVLVGKLKVGVSVERAEAAKILKHDNLWEATYHVIAERGTEEPMKEISLMDVAANLRFISSTQRDRLAVNNGRVDGKQLQAMRELAHGSVSLLESKWYGAPLPSEEEELLQSSGAGFGSPLINKQVERAAVSFVANMYEEKGWNVVSVEAEKCGFDLLCRKGRQLEHVEVKGSQSKEPTFIITANELKQAKTDFYFALCVVTSALSNNPHLHRYSGQEFISEFTLKPLAFKARLKNRI